MIPCFVTIFNSLHQNKSWQNHFVKKYLKEYQTTFSHYYLKLSLYSITFNNFLDCHTTLTESHGEIKSYGFPQGYYHNMDCTWLIQRSHGEVIEIRFISFDVESVYVNLHVDCK